MVQPKYHANSRLLCYVFVTAPIFDFYFLHLKEENVIHVIFISLLNHLVQHKSSGSYLLWCVYFFSCN